MWDQSTDKLIEEVEKRPALYLKSLKEYSDSNYKKKLKTGMSWLLKRKKLKVIICTLGS
jgi:hypothetical protein